MSKTFHRVTRQPLPMRCSTWTPNSVLASLRTCSRPWHVLEDLLEFHVPEFFGLEVEISFYACTRDRHQSRSRRLEATTFLRVGCQECWRQRRRNHRSSQSLFCFSTSFWCLARVLGSPLRTLRSSIVAKMRLPRSTLVLLTRCLAESRENISTAPRCKRCLFEPVFFIASRMRQARVENLSQSDKTNFSKSMFMNNNNFVACQSTHVPSMTYF